jgi:putative tricarboxylic transport membrane protein
MKAADLVVAFVLVAIGSIVVFDSARIGYGWGTDGPQSGFLPFWLGVLLIASALVIALQASLRRTSETFVTRQQLIPVLKVLAPAIALVLLTETIGLYVASMLYLAVYMRWIGRHRWLTIAVIAIGVPLATFFVFEQWFLVPMPKGPLEDWLGY